LFFDDKHINKKDDVTKTFDVVINLYFGSILMRCDVTEYWGAFTHRD